MPSLAAKSVKGVCNIIYTLTCHGIRKPSKTMGVKERNIVGSGYECCGMVSSIHKSLNTGIQRAMSHQQSSPSIF